MSTTAFGDPVPEPLATVTPVRAGFWIRFGALVVDVIIVGVVSVVLQLALGTAGQVIGLVLGIAYYIYLEGPGGQGQTLGKRVAGVRVVSSTTGAPIGYGAATGRYFGRILSSIPILLGYFWMLWDGEKQTWHDKLAGSYVVPADA
ncbi:unannotated protein [freshwater metagenome]|uniref:Unannotated protein n=1 Tax=freshwater metagenome TaxID=449393 RepID=A0A6J7KDA0_9ZZZZ|nr:hypothetical protein [Actinomycetota bacterium]